MVRLISLCWGNVAAVLELEDKEGKLIGKLAECHHNFTFPHMVYEGREFSSLEQAKDSLSMYSDHGPVFTEEEQIAGCNKLFPEGIDVVQLSAGAAINCTIAYRPKGYDVVWKEEGGYSPNLPRREQFKLSDRFVIIRIPENGQVRCPKRFMGRVLGKKGVKINELSKKHGIKIRLIEIPDSV